MIVQQQSRELEKAKPQQQQQRPSVAMAERVLPSISRPPVQSSPKLISSTDDELEVAGSSEPFEITSDRTPPETVSEPEEAEPTPRRASSPGRKTSSKKAKGYSVRVFKSVIDSKTPHPLALPFPDVSQADLEARADAVVRATVSGYLERFRVEVLREVQLKLKVVDTVISKIDTKIDRDFVERMFNKFRVVVGEVKSKVDQVQCTLMSWVTREELKEVLEKFAEQLAEVKDTAGAKSRYRCLLCGKPRTHLSGMIVGAGLEEIDAEKPKKSARPATATPRVTTPLEATRVVGTARPPPRDVIQLLTAEPHIG
jgi:hypothetical protein